MTERLWYTLASASEGDTRTDQQMAALLGVQPDELGGCGPAGMITDISERRSDRVSVAPRDPFTPLAMI